MKKGLLPVLALVLLAAALCGACGPAPEAAVTAAPSAAPTVIPTEAPPSPAPVAVPAHTPEPTAAVTAPTPAAVASSEAPTPVEAPAATTCALSVNCATVLDNLDLLDPDKVELIPADGILLSTVSTDFTEGESAFDILKRVAQEYRLHFAFVQTPAFRSAYVDGIGNLYEFDCGALSGWMYSVNGVFPPYSSSQYIVQPDDEIRFLYTCDLGDDIGGSNY